MSSESDTFDSDEMRHFHSRHGRGRHHNSSTKGLSSKVDRLASTLQATNKNLKEVDRMLCDYKDVGEEQGGTINKLKRDLERTKERLEEEKDRQSLRESGRSLRASDLDDKRDRRRRKPTSPLRDYDRPSSDRESGDKDRRSRISVRFFDDMATSDHPHEVHQSIRDLASGQMRLEEDIDREIGQRRRYETDSQAFFAELRNSFKAPEALQHVNKKLQDIQEELRSERLNIKRGDDAERISMELKSALTDRKDGPAMGATMFNGHNSDIQKHQLESELDSVRWKLDQAEGGRDELAVQIQELRKQLSRADQERQRLNMLIEEQDSEIRERRKQRAGLPFGRDADEQKQEQWVSEKHQLNDELHTMRSHLTKSAVAMGEYTDLRQELEKSERQRTQLSDHIQVLKKEIESREKEQVTTMKKLQDTAEALQEMERGRHQALRQLEDALTRLRDLTGDAEKIAGENRATFNLLEESEKQKDELKMRAQETIRQWKAKCKKLERDFDRQQHSAQQATQRSEELIKELEMLRNQSQTGVQQMDHFKRELGDLLAIRAQQDEQVRIKDVENNELRALKMDLERDLRDCKVVIERLEQELRSANDKNMQLYDEKAKFEDQLGAAQTAQVLLQNQLQQMQKECKDISFEKVELATQLADIAKERNELRMGLQDLQKSEALAREEAEALGRRLREEKDLYSTRMDAMKIELEKYKAREAHIIQELSRRFNKEQAECQAQLHALKIELQEEKSLNKLQKKQMDKLKHEMEKLHHKLTKSQEEVEKVQSKYYKIREEYITKSQLTEDDITKAQEIELELLDACEKRKRIEKDFQNILYSLHAEINSVVETVSFDSLEAYKAIVPSTVGPEDPSRWFAEVKSKLDWVKNEFRERRHAEISSWKKDHHVHFSGESLSGRSSCNISPDANSAVERDVDEEIANGNHEGVHTAESFEDALNSLRLEEEKEHLQMEVAVLKDSQKERDKIHERYAKLQETISILKQELLDTKNPLLAVQQSTTDSLRKHRKQVRISDEPAFECTFEDDASSPDRSSTNRTPSPLKLTDEEFASRFIPKTPE